MANRKPWTPEEDEIIIALIQQFGINQWTTVAAQMKKHIPSHRTSKQIRERWYNQLNPNISKQEWTTSEESTLFEAHARLGNKWKQIAAQLQGRTDNAVKNHFYSTIRRSLRRLDKHFGFRDSTKKMRNLKPSALTFFLQKTQKLPLYSDIMCIILQFAQLKPTRQNKLHLSSQTRSLYDFILQLISDYQNRQQKQKREGNDAEATEQGESTNSDQVLEEKEESEMEGSNYFGDGPRVQNWFDGAELEKGLLCPQNMILLCEQDHWQ